MGLTPAVQLQRQGCICGALRRQADGLWGGIDNCFTIPNGTVEEVRQHIRENFRLLGKNGRYIASSHDIPEQVPMENIEAMVDELKRCVYNREE